MMKPACVVTGASGLLGHVLAEKLSERADVVGVAHHHPLPGQVPLDIRDQPKLTSLLRERKPDVVVHCAAYRDPDFCEQNPAEAERLNVAPAKAMSEVLPPEATLVFVSSDYVFDGRSPPYSETSPVSPLSVYGQSKVRAEQAVLRHPGALVVRCPVLIGSMPGRPLTGFIEQMVAAARATEDVLLDDVHVRFPTYNRDVAAAIDFLLETGARGIYHVSGALGGTRYGLTLEVARALSLPSGHLRPSREMVHRVAARPRDSQLATGKIRALGFNAFTDYRDVVRRAVEGRG